MRAEQLRAATRYQRVTVLARDAIFVMTVLSVRALSVCALFVVGALLAKAGPPVGRGA